MGGRFGAGVALGVGVVVVVVRAGCPFWEEWR